MLRAQLPVESMLLQAPLYENPHTVHNSKYLRSPRSAVHHVAAFDNLILFTPCGWPLQTKKYFRSIVPIEIRYLLLFAIPFITFWQVDLVHTVLIATVAA